MAGDDIYIGDVVITETDTYLSDDARLHKDGDNLVVQIKVGGVWIDQETWGA